MPIQPDGTSLDTILRVAEILSIIGGGSLVAFRLGRNTGKIQAAMEIQSDAIKLQGQEVSELKTEIKQLNSVLTTLALQQQRLDMIEKTIDELRHGEGYVLPIVPRQQRST